MSNLSQVISNKRPPPIPADITFRTATMDDLPFIDGLQKKSTKQVGYFPTAQFKGYIEMDAVVIAEIGGIPVGYCISRDRYLKRDELGVIFQLNVVETYRRKFVGAALIGEVFRRSAYGCRLYCLWCAKDLDANRFWESLGFVPIAFRAGSTGKKRVHIFWEKKINENDTTTNWWYPSQTASGAIRQDRLVFPIPPGTHWTEVEAIARPVEEIPTPRKQIRKKRSKNPNEGKIAIFVKGKIRHVPKPYNALETVKPITMIETLPALVKNRVKESVKMDPELVKKARELRDRYLERLNIDPSCLMVEGKYNLLKYPNNNPPNRLAA